jgi:hypothetical protein
MNFCSSWDWRRDLNADEVVRRDELLLEVSQIQEELVDLEVLAQLPHIVEDDLFFEKLTESIKKSALQLQKNSLIAESNEKKIIAKELYELRKNFDFNHERICLLENQMSNIMEGEIADKVSNFIKDDVLNLEKMTPRFLNIARAKCQDNLNLIKKPDGTDFADKTDRGKFIKDFYMNLYAVPAELQGLNLKGCVKKFLGPEICNNPTVAGMRILPDEQERLDEPISIEELDEAFRGSRHRVLMVSITSS